MGHDLYKGRSEGSQSELYNAGAFIYKVAIDYIKFIISCLLFLTSIL
jgi:hypothetical protein